MSRIARVAPAIATTPEAQRKVAESLNRLVDQNQPFGSYGVATLTVTATDEYGDYPIDATTGTATVTLPEAAAYTGKVLSISKVDSSANTVIVDGFGSELIAGSITFALVLQYETITLTSNGTYWYAK